MQRIILTNLCRQGYNIREEERQVENEKNFEIFVINENQEKAFKLVRTENADCSDTSYSVEFPPKITANVFFCI